MSEFDDVVREIEALRNKGVGASSEGSPLPIDPSGVPEDILAEVQKRRKAMETKHPGEDLTLSRLVKNIGPDAWETAKATFFPLAHPVQFAHGVRYLLNDKNARKAVWDDLKGRYGGIKEIERYAVDHPVQFGMDVSTLLSGIGVLAKMPGMAGKAAGIAGRVGKEVHPLSVATAPLRGFRAAIGATKAPEALYESAMKIPPGSLRQEFRDKALKTMVRDERMPLAPKTVGKMSEIIGGLESDINKTLSALSSAGSEINISDVVTRLERLKRTYEGFPEAGRYSAVIDKVIDQYAHHAFVRGGSLSLADAQQLKKGTYQQIASYYKKGQKPETGRVGIRNEVEAVAKAEAASVLRNSILDHPDVPPEIRAMMSREAGLMNARKWVERATNRGGNLDVINLSGMLFGVLVEKGVPGAIAWKIVSGQKMKSRIALNLAHGNKTLRKMGAVARSGSLGTFQAGRLSLKSNKAITEYKEPEE